MTEHYDYNTPAEGTVDWHIPLNENFATIAENVSAIAAQLGVSVSANYVQPAAGTTDWHIPLNENFEAIEADVQTLASAAEVSGVGGYNTPSEGTVDWHIPLNENFEQIDGDLASIASSIGVGLSGMKTLSTTDLWLSLLGSDTDRVVYDATAFSGSTLAEQVTNAFAAMESEVDGRAIVWVPAGSYSWDTTVSVSTGSVWGPMFLFDTDARIDVGADWAFDFSPANEWYLVNDQRTAVKVVGGQWTNRGTGTIRARDIYRGLFAPVSVTGGVYGLEVLRDGGWSEGWSVRDAVFEGVDKPIYFNSQSADQQLLANLTFRDFEKAVHIDASAQNYTAVNLRFENARTGAVGMHFETYTTGTIYNPQWTSSTGTLFRFGDYAKPSVVDAEVASGAQFSIVDEGGDAVTSSGVPWQGGHLSPLVTDGGPTLNGPVVRTDVYDGSLPVRVEAAAADLPNGGTILVPGSQSKLWDATASIALDGRDIAIVTPENARIDVTTSGWALDVSGDGTFAVYGGYWDGNDSSPGWLTTDVPNLDASPTEVRSFGTGSGIDAAPRSKGRYRVYDMRFIHTTTAASNPDAVACVQLGGAGCAELHVMHIELENMKRGFRFDAPVDSFHGMRVSAHPWNDNAIFAETNASVDGTWFNPKWEAPGLTGTAVFDNESTSSPPPVVEPWAWGGEQGVELWRGTKPQFFPDYDTQVSSAHVP